MLFAIGINHKTAPIEIREKLVFNPDKINLALNEILGINDINEAAIISTCNRTEIFLVTEQQQQPPIIDWLKKYHRLNTTDLESYLYNFSGMAAVKHILRLACGLDSMVLGEPQILGQLKKTFQSAQQAGTLGTQLNRLFQHTFTVAKQVRSSTAIGASPVSVAFAAVTLAKRIFSDMNKHTALLIGAGETIELAARHLQKTGIKQIFIANRTLEKAQQLTQEVTATAIKLDDIHAYLPLADIVISSTASPVPIIGKGAIENALRIRKYRPMLMIDIAVPRDIEPEAAALDDLYLYTVDDLKDIIEDSLRSRQEAALQAEQIIDAQVDHFSRLLKSLDTIDTIRQLRQGAENSRDEEVKMALRRLRNNEDAEEVIQRLAHGLTNKLLHAPSRQIKKAGYEGRQDVLDAAIELLDIKKDA